MSSPSGTTPPTPPPSNSVNSLRSPARMMSPAVKSPISPSLSISSSSSTTTSSATGCSLSLEERFDRLVNLLGIGPTLLEGKSINSEVLFDVLIAVYYECQRVIATTRNKQQQRFCEFIKPFLDRVFDLHLKVTDFEQLKIIGRGAFGQVALVKAKENGNIFAMKTLNKLEMLKRAETACFREERDVLLHGSQDWFTKLHYAFQDDTNLYLIMDYYIGGDLLTLLSKYDDNLPEDMCRFYTAQIILGE